MSSHNENIDLIVKLSEYSKIANTYKEHYERLSNYMNSVSKNINKTLKSNDTDKINKLLKALELLEFDRLFKF